MLLILILISRGEGAAQYYDRPFLAIRQGDKNMENMNAKHVQFIAPGDNGEVWRLKPE